MRETFFESGTGKTADRLNLLLIDAIDRVHAPGTAGLLARFAAFSPSEEIRVAACNALKKRPRYEFVPQLIAAMPPRSSAEMVYQIQFLPGGFIQLIAESSRQEGRTEFNQSYDMTVGSFWFSIWRHSQGIDWQKSIGHVSSAVANLQRQAVLEKRREANNGRLRAQIALVLEQTTDFEPSDDPEQWQRQWSAYQETYTPELSTQPRKSFRSPRPALS